MIFTFFSCLVFSQIGKFNIEKLFYFENNQYKEIYKKDFGLEGKEYENNILITFVAYKDDKTYNCRLLKGALVNDDVAECFSNYNSVFKKSLSENLQNEDGYSEKLYDILSKSLNKVTETYETKIDATEYETPKYSKIVTKYSYKGNDNTSDLNSSIENFYKVTGTNISFVIANNNQVYQPNWFLFSSLSVFALAGMFLGTFSIVKQKKDKKFLKREIENGNGKMYFEGEFPYEKYFKNDEIIEEK